MNAIPTVYNGIQFRSRLEARWACLFDLLGWTYQYEPFDLNGYIPDFLLTSDPKNPILAEVKPITNLVGEEIYRAIQKINDSSWNGLVVILGCTIFDKEYKTILGWWRTQNYAWIEFDIFGDPKELMSLWNQAGNMVQWRGEQSITEDHR